MPGVGRTLRVSILGVKVQEPRRYHISIQVLVPGQPAVGVVGLGDDARRPDTVARTETSALSRNPEFLNRCFVLRLPSPLGGNNMSPQAALQCNLMGMPSVEGQAGGCERWQTISVSCGGRHTVCLALPVREGMGGCDVSTSEDAIDDGSEQSQFDSTTKLDSCGSPPIPEDLLGNSISLMDWTVNLGDSGDMEEGGMDEAADDEDEVTEVDGEQEIESETGEEEGEEGVEEEELFLREGAEGSGGRNLELSEDGGMVEEPLQQKIPQSFGHSSSRSAPNPRPTLAEAIAVPGPMRSNSPALGPPLRAGSPGAMRVGSPGLTLMGGMGSPRLGRSLGATTEMGRSLRSSHIG